MRTFIATVLFIGVFVAAILIGGQIGIFIDLPSVLVVLGGMIFGVIAKHSFKELKNFKANGDSIIGSAIIASIISGVLGTILGIIMILSNLSEPKAIGPALAISLLTTVYALIASACLFFIGKNVKVSGVLVVAPLALLMMDGGAFALTIYSLGWG